MQAPTGLTRDAKPREMEEILIPEGKQLFTLYNMFFGKFNGSPKGKKFRTDFTWSYSQTFEHVDTGMLLSRLDNGADNPFFATQQKIYRVGNVDNYYRFVELMEAIGAPFHQEKEGSETGTYWVKKGDVYVFPGYDEKPAGPLGLPVILEVIHKDVPVLTIRDGAVKNQWGRYDNEDYVQKCDDNGKPMTQKKEFIRCFDPKQHDSWDSNEFKAIIESGFPIVYELPEEHKDVRGVYFIPEEPSSNSGNSGVTNSERAKFKEEEDKMTW